jgi:hypothetical protein
MLIFSIPRGPRAVFATQRDSSCNRLLTSLALLNRGSRRHGELRTAAQLHRSSQGPLPRPVVLQRFSVATSRIMARKAEGETFPVSAPAAGAGVPWLAPALSRTRPYPRRCAASSDRTPWSSTQLRLYRARFAVVVRRVLVKEVDPTLASGHEDQPRFRVEHLSIGTAAEGND